MSQSTIVLIILGIFIVSLLMNKWSFGITGITTCILLFLFYYKGDIGAAFSGLTNQVIFLMVGMYGLSAAFARTSLLKKMQEILNSLQGKKGIFLVLCIFGVAFLFGNFFPSAVTVSLMMTFVATLGNENAISSDRLCVPIAGIAGMSMGVLPMGSALVSYTAMNAFYEGMITDARQLVTMWDPFKMGIPMFLFGFIWCLIGYKIQPQKGRAILSTTKKDNGQKKSAASKAPLSKRDETIVYLCFGGTMIAHCRSDPSVHKGDSKPRYGPFRLLSHFLYGHRHSFHVQCPWSIRSRRDSWKCSPEADGKQSFSYVCFFCRHDRHSDYDFTDVKHRHQRGSLSHRRSNGYCCWLESGSFCDCCKKTGMVCDPASVRFLSLCHGPCNL